MLLEGFSRKEIVKSLLIKGKCYVYCVVNVTVKCEVGGYPNNHSGTALPSDIQRGRYVTVRFCVENL